MATPPKAFTYVDQDQSWHEGNPMVLGPMTQSTWLGSLVFDGARWFEGTIPDVDQHCERACRSARNMLLEPKIRPQEIVELIKDGVSKFDGSTALYLKPMFWADGGWIYPDPDTTRFMLTIYESPLPEDTGFSVNISEKVRPMPTAAPVDAKAACLYANAGRALKLAHEAGYDNCVVLDPIGNVAELATANLFFAKDGEVHTPIPNGTFLNGITRQRVIKLLTKAGYKVHERVVTTGELMEADEIFSCGNHGKVMSITKIVDRALQPGPITAKARELYWAYAHGDA
ncbi:MULTISPECIES: branched-chain amino acid aminotransferase [Thalassobaculum]|uniref:Probable branched-chain-amino-acid aminotransferase n=1 Tax=Thalassobaculum litoreum DSM 18839 TaxID=1123362 RepID=A0A8G2BJ10_9PROT|nr:MULTISPECIES: branched-chain amino acid aminotransferase [Thalassobaculum]SDF97692.1 branched-chain amino acid aminotransferase [Thalassobaculum litoreum DSM 18839]